MFNSCYPSHIQEILSGLQSGEPPEQVLIQWADFINKDCMLYTLYEKLTYNPVSRKFSIRPEASHVIELLNNHYDAKPYDLSGLNISCEDSNLQVDDSSLSTVWSQEQDSISSAIDSRETFRSLPKQKGLRQLSMRVRDLIYQKGSTSYKEVSDELILELWGIENDKNIRRRVYDAINVLVSSGIIQKNGKQVKWGRKPQDLTNEGRELTKKIQEKRAILSERRKNLSEITNRYTGLTGLIERNRNTKTVDDYIKFPYLVVASSDDPENSLTVRINNDNSKIWLSFAKQFRIVGDIETILKFRNNVTASTVPNRVKELINKS